MEKNYADSRAALLRDLDGLRVEVDPDKRIGYLILDRPPLNIVSYTARSQIAGIIEEMDRDDDVGVICIRGANGVFTSGGDVKSFPDIPKNGMSDLHYNIAAPERADKPVIAALEKYCFGRRFRAGHGRATSGWRPRRRWWRCPKARSGRCLARAAASASRASSA